MSSESTVIAYHLSELATARDPESPYHAMPGFGPDTKAVLDIGCGIGQTLVASGLQNAFLVGLDTDAEALAYGHRQFSHIYFVNGSAESLPFDDGAFDCVVSRVSLPYTNLTKSLSEVSRVLADNGTVWLTLHGVDYALKGFFRALRSLRAKALLFRTYVIVNGIVFHIGGRLFWLLDAKRMKRYESFQTIGSMTRALKRNGFADVEVRRQGPHMICTARKRQREDPR
jgi:SAM-dependent methyltransferase